jgi:hypothetical protein
MTVNSRVAYSRSFLSSIHDDGSMGKDRGTVIQVKAAVKKPGCTIPARISVLWDGETEPRTSLASNLIPC